jgi:sirohydrochlorin ferrochelatase
LRLHRLATTLTLSFLLPIAPTALGAQQPPQSPGLLVVAHGADSTWNARVGEVVSQVRWSGPVELAFLMGDAAHSGQGWNEALGRIEATGVGRVVVVPLMVSSHGSHTRQIAHYAGVRDEFPPELAGHQHGPVSHPRIPAVVTPALDAAPELGTILLDRWQAMNEVDRARSLVLVAHGPVDDDDAARWVAELSSATTALAEKVGRDRVRIGLLRDDAPPDQRALAVAAIRDTISALAAREKDDVLVMTVLISSSGLDRVRVPTDLSGTPMRYAGVVLSPHPALARWIERVATEAVR